MSEIESNEPGGELEPHGDGEIALPPHHPRRTDTDARAAKRAERQVAIMFGLAMVLTIAFIAVYVWSPDGAVALPVLGRIGTENLLLGLTMGLALFLVGAGAIHWARKLMSDEEIVQARHEIATDEKSRSQVVEEFMLGADESGFTKRPLIRRTLIGAMVLLPLPALVLLRDLGPLPEKRLRGTLWAPGVRVVTDVTYRPIRPEQIPLGGFVSAVPANLVKAEEETGSLNERGKSAIVIVRMLPSEIKSQQIPGGDVQGVIAFSKICTHVGCPLGLYEQRTHTLLCPCHQSTFDLADDGNVLFGPAARSLPQLAITVDSEGYLVAKEGFQQPVGPSFWERG